MQKTHATRAELTLATVTEMILNAGKPETVVEPIDVEFMAALAATANAHATLVLADRTAALVREQQAANLIAIAAHEFLDDDTSPKLYRHIRNYARTILTPTPAADAQNGAEL